jgi:hypothetical protein
MALTPYLKWGRKTRGHKILQGFVPSTAHIFREVSQYGVAPATGILSSLIESNCSLLRPISRLMAISSRRHAPILAVCWLESSFALDSSLAVVGEERLQLS